MLRGFSANGWKMAEMLGICRKDLRHEKAARRPGGPEAAKSLRMLREEPVFEPSNPGICGLEGL